MGRTYTKLLYHAVFSTKGRRHLLKGKHDEAMNAYLAGIVKNIDGWLIRAGGGPDHRHLLIELKPTICVSDALWRIKGASSKWAGEQAGQFGFNWQKGFSAFTVSPSMAPEVIRYIDTQKEHHRKMSVEEEVILLLEKHGIPYDRKHLFD